MSLNNSSASANYDTIDFGNNNKNITVTGLTLSGTGIDASNYSISSISGTVGTIKKASITCSLTDAIDAVSKTYDGTTNATIASTNYSFTGVASVDNTTAKFNFTGPTTGSYVDPQAGTKKIVTVTGITAGNFTGSSIANYTFPTSAVGNVGIINQLGLTVSLVNGAMNKVYDSTTNVILDPTQTLPAGTYTLNPSIISGDVVKLVSTQAEFNDSGVLSADSVSVSGLSVLAGQPGANNYKILNGDAALTASANISKKTLGINASGTAIKEYDGTTDANSATLAGVTFSVDPNSVCGEDLVSVGSFSPPTSGTYDIQNANATNGVLIGTAGTVTVTQSDENLSLDGNSKDNYVFPATMLVGGAIINQKELTVTADPKSKIYGDDDSFLTYVHSDLVNGDSISGTLARAAGNNVGSYAINQGTVSAG
ncbi:MAG: YDG domain-containing protein, partial [Gammaproteobacteria bacterium]